jgi:CDP-glucose 4,6-dehydratase
MDSSFWLNRPAFVTGATGFVGAHVVRTLVNQGARVVCLQRDDVKAGTLDLLDLRRHVTVIRGDLADYALMERALNEYEIEAVFHLAAQALVGVANRSPLSTFETNVRGTYLLMEACRVTKSVGRVVVASSDKAYGTHDDLPYGEDYPLLGLFPYDASKVCTDVIARSYAHTYKLPVAVTRFANVYGPGDTNLSRVIPSAIISALKGEPPVIRSDGTPIREFVYVDDVARGYLLLAEKIEEARGEAFNFGTGEQVQMLDLVKRIIRLTGREGQLEPRVMLARKIENEIDAQYLSAEKVGARFGWRAEVSLDEGLRRSIEWYRENLERVG